MKKAIIHISDLHICLHEDLKGRITENSNKYWLTTNPNDITSEFVNRFCVKIKTNYNQDDELYLLVTGDITDKSLEKENEVAEKIISDILANLSIPKSRLLLLPGDHDINWKICEEAHSLDKKNLGNKKSYEFDEKYCYFKILYEKLTDRIFDSSKVIVNYLKFEIEKMIIIGINSNYKIDYEGGAGFVELDKLKIEMTQLNIPNDYSIIVAFHHNIFSEFENSQTGSWDTVNRKDVLEFFHTKQIKCFFYGNEHTRNSKLEGASYNDLIISSDSGSISSKFHPTPSFKVYDINYDSSFLILKNNIYKYHDEGSINSNGKWVLENSLELGEVETFELIKKKNTPQIEVNLIGSDYEPNLKEIIQIDYKTNEKNYSEILFEIVKEKKLFHSGHFHWSETSRSHNWIDVTKILNNNEDLSIAKDAVIDLISKNILIKSRNFDFVIGLGIEGNILSTKLAIMQNKPYSFLPYSYRYDDHNDFEKQLYFENNGTYKSVLIITDVVNEGRTIRKLIHKRANKFFEKVNKIYVVSLFYTGDAQNINPFILNLNAREITEKEIIGDHIENRIEFYYVLDMKVEKCPYKENYRNDCLIMREPSLGCVHRFYDEAKALKKLEFKKSK